MNERRGSAWMALGAGVLGGAAAGAGDAAATLVRGVGGVVGMHLVRVSMVAVGLGGLAGAALAMLAFAVAALMPGHPERRAMATAAILGAPLVIHDAFALFAGPQAAKVPGHAVLSILLVLAGTAALAWLARLFVSWFDRRPVLPLLGSLAVAVACYWTNRHVLPRLYPWFHDTLTVLYLTSGVVAARLLLGPTSTVPGKAAGRRALLALAAAAAAFGLQLPNTLWHPIIRYAAHERTQLTGLLLRALPNPRLRSSAVRTAAPRAILPTGPLPEGPHRPNTDLVLITVDALRADHVGAYGYPRPTTPNIDALARRGVRFERAYTQAPHTSFSIASLLTGKYYPAVARIAPGEAHDPITEVLRRYGWKTAAFYPPAVFYVDGQKLKAYQDNNFRFEYVKFEYLDAFRRLDQIDEFFRSDHPGKAFLWLHLFEPHEPYDARADHDFGRRDVDRYDSEIAYTDAAIGKLVEYLEKHRPGAIIIVTADHGEEFDEHGGRYHGTSLYEEQVRVPLVVVVPGLAPHVVSGPVELIDLAPTILGLVDIPAPPRMRGTDLGPWLAVPGAPASWLPPAFAEVGEKRMAVWGTDKLICEMNLGYCAFYDLLADPREQRNQAEALPERAGRLKQFLDDWLDDHVRSEPPPARGHAIADDSAVPPAIERGRLGDRQVARALADMLQSPEAIAVRREAARLLVTLPPREETRNAAVAAMSADDPEVGAWAAVAAARLGDRSARGRIRQQIERGEGGRELRVHAAVALAQAMDPTGVPVLADALNDCRDDVLFCQRIISVLGSLRDRRAVPALLAHLSEVQNRREMVEALGAIGDPSVVDALSERLATDAYVPVRTEAARALGRLGGTQARAALEKAARAERETSVLTAVRAALTALASSPPAATRDRPRSPRRAAAR